MPKRTRLFGLSHDQQTMKYSSDYWHSFMQIEILYGFLGA